MSSTRTEDRRSREAMVEELQSTVRTAEAQAQEYMDLVRIHDADWESALEELRDGWQGGRSHEVLTSLEQTHHSLRTSYLAEAHRLQDQADEARRQIRLGADEAETPRREGGESWD